MQTMRVLKAMQTSVDFVLRPTLTRICVLVFIVFLQQIGMSQQLGSTTSLASYRTVKSPKNLDFQIRIDLYSDDSKPPINSLQTVFTDGLAIEFNDQQGRCTVVDSAKGRITLLDNERKILAHIDMQAIETQLDRAIDQMSEVQQKALSSDGPPIAESNEYFAISNAFVRYRFKPVATKPEIATSYAEFTDWITRLYALHGPKMPPQMRLELNRLLAEQSQLPAELRRIIVYGAKTEQPRTEEIIARLIVTESLSDSDRSRVANVYRCMGEYKPTLESNFFK
jgi:hypothetical protein